MSAAGGDGRSPRVTERSQVQLAVSQSMFCEFDMGECRTSFMPLLYEMSRVSTETADLPRILRILMRLLRQYLKAERGSISLRDPDGGEVSVHDSFGAWDEHEPGLHALSQRAIARGEAGVIAHIPGEPDFQGNPLAPSHSTLCAPIMRNSRVIGTLSAQRVYLNRRLLNLDLEILSILAMHIAPAVDLYLRETVRRTSLEDENRRLRDAVRERFKPSNIIGSSQAMQGVYALIERVTRSKTTVLILGESGVGKELVASAIHYNGPDADGPFIKFNCAALPESIIESELFGHERGAFTGAHSTRRGRFEEADGGTIFIDEVGELSLAMQAKLLRILQERDFERVGGNTTIQVDLRVLAATNRDLQAMVRQGTFREDLYYRLNVFPIAIPSLRERGHDIMALAEHFVARFASDMGVEIHGIAAGAQNMLLCYHWPGNVRELENVIERAVILAEGGTIEAAHLPPSLQTPVASELASGTGGRLEARLGAVEYEMIAEALQLHHGNMTEAAHHLKLSRRVLGLRMERYGLTYKDFR
ncbi:Nif-specific regulatory protein [Plasticicumulans acidivorans]|uniref:Nif-specific regulatory protein n=2 Tax=Plasticicumulans acidivorans TaxID=886464 RepID=A0A317MX42_9GAMM|nr:sigma 54-interacting transcriptional regulator [Plasticicumulans acidivorans]PWV63088.1 Nif-specific regulatory protein [Plasticicumulans acidivorans]